MVTAFFLLTHMFKYTVVVIGILDNKSIVKVNLIQFKAAHIYTKDQKESPKQIKNNSKSFNVC